jgi:hypothetical protein
MTFEGESSASARAKAAARARACRMCVTGRLSQDGGQGAGAEVVKNLGVLRRCFFLAPRENTPISLR